MNLVEAARCIKKRQRVLGTRLDGAKFITEEYHYIYKLEVTSGKKDKLIYSAVLADTLALSGEPKSTVSMKLDNVRISPYK